MRGQAGPRLGTCPAPELQAPEAREAGAGPRDPQSPPTSGPLPGPFLPPQSQSLQPPRLTFKSPGYGSSRLTTSPPQPQGPHPPRPLCLPGYHPPKAEATGMDAGWHGRERRGGGRWPSGAWVWGYLALPTRCSRRSSVPTASNLGHGRGLALVNDAWAGEEQACAALSHQVGPSPQSQASNLELGNPRLSEVPGGRGDGEGLALPLGCLRSVPRQRAAHRLTERNRAPAVCAHVPGSRGGRSSRGHRQAWPPDW